MGYYRLPKPGERDPGGREIGVCVGECDHIDCNKTRTDAKSICRICKKEIGYDRNFYYEDVHVPKLVHAPCLQEESEKRKGGGES